MRAKTEQQKRGKGRKVKKARGLQIREEPGKLNPGWLKQFVKEFRAYLRETKFPEPERNGE